jgi:ATP-dependent Lhr-like helicase
VIYSIIKDLPTMDLKKTTEEAVERSGIFKRRIIHAGKKCGAISKEADYASVSIAGLIEALRETPVYDEAMSMIFHDDLDLEGSARILELIRGGSIVLKVLDYEGLSPIARIGVEEISRRGEVVSPERLKALLRQSTLARISETFLVAVCCNCWNFVELKKVSDLDGLMGCPNCGKEMVGVSTESYESVFSLALKARSRTVFKGRKLRTIESIRKTAELRKEYGHAFDMLLAGRGVRLADAANLAVKRRNEGLDLIDLIIEGEREALRRRYFVAAS